MTLRTRLAFWFASLLALIICLFSATVYSVMWFSMVHDVDARLQETAGLIETDGSFAILPVQPPRRYEVRLPKLGFMRASGTEAQVWINEDGQYRQTDQTANLVNFPNALDSSMLGSTGDHTFTTVNIDGVLWRVHTGPIWYGGQTIGSIQVAQSLETFHLATRQLLLVVLICAAVAILGSMVLSRWLANRLLRPVQDLTLAASHIAGASDLSTRLTWSGPNDELGRLIAVFNRMMERLQHVFTVQQRFVADVSHELRTPLTGILGHVELMRRYGADEDSLNAIHSDTDRVARLVNDLLMLARADYGGVTVNLQPVDADAIVTQSIQAAKHKAEQNSVRLSVVHVEPLRVMGDPLHLKQLLGNLIDNAIKFTPSGGIVMLSLQRIDQMACIEIADTGIGISAEHQPHIFDRFYQVDTSRSQDGTGGFGLGLSVARWIAEAHHGSIEVRSRPGEGSTFTAHIPLVQPETEPSQPSSQDTPTRLPRLRVGETKVETVSSTQ